MSKRIGILGGTFNPIHNQHLLLAKTAYEQLSLEKILLIPSGISYLKAGTNVLPAEIRYEMCLLASKSVPYLDVSDIEIRRKGNSYTCDTLRELLSEDPERILYFIVGSDTLMMLEKWKDPEYIFRNCIITAAKRLDDNNYTDDKINACIRKYENIYNAEIETIDIAISDLSSSMIRDAASKGDDISPYVPKDVVDYIKDKGLYKD